MVDISLTQNLCSPEPGLFSTSDLLSALIQAAATVFTAVFTVWAWERRKIAHERIVSNGVEPLLELVEKLRKQLRRYDVEDKIGEVLFGDFDHYYPAFRRLRGHLQTRGLVDRDSNDDPIQRIVRDEMVTLVQFTREYLGKRDTEIGPSGWAAFTTRVRNAIGGLDRVEEFLGIVERTHASIRTAPELRQGFSKLQLPPASPSSVA